MTPESVVDFARRRGISFVALTDHNSVTNCERLLNAAEAAGDIWAIPGVEITTSQGHVLVYCSADKLPELERLLARLDFQKDEGGGDYTLSRITEIAANAAAFEGIAIPAHCGRPSTGFLMKAPHRDAQAIFESRDVLGVELDTNGQLEWFTAADKSAGSQERASYLSARAHALEGTPAANRLTRLIFSDAHSLASIGVARDGSERLTRIKMELPSFDGFKAALLDPDARIVLEGPLPEIYPRIVGVRFGGGFLDAEEIAFAPNLTALIGGRGAGKSTALEALRAACAAGESEIEGSDAWPQTVQVEYIDSFGGTHFIQRDAGTGQPFEVVADGSVMPAEIPLEGYEQDHIAEIIRSAERKPEALLSFLDRFVGSAAPATLAELAIELKENAAALSPVFDAPELLKKAQADLATAKGRIQLAEKSKAKEALQWRRLLSQERQLRQLVIDSVEAVDQAARDVPSVESLADLAEAAGIEDINTLPSKAVLIGSSDEAGLAGLLDHLGAEIDRWKKRGHDQRAERRAELDDLLTRWNTRDAQVEARIQRIVEKLRAEGISPDLAQLNRLATAESQAQQRVTARSAEVRTRRDLLAARAELLRRYRAAQIRLTMDRNAFGKKVAQQFKEAGVGFAVGIKFREGMLVERYEEWLREAIGLRFLRGERVTQFCQSIHPVDLADALRAKKHGVLLGLSDLKGTPFLTRDEARDFVAHVGASSERISELDLITRDDKPEISLTQIQDGKARTYPFGHLSFGQRASILLGALLFSEDVHPLVIDQLEDHLDSAFIYEAVVRTLRRVKERRQVVVATHNANIAVLGDAELIVPLRSWAGKGRITERGSVDTEETRRRACTILEGGEDAYLRRGEMYGIRD